MRARSSRPFCPYDSRRVCLGDLSAGLRYTTCCRSTPALTAWLTSYCPIVVRMIVWTRAVRSCEEAIQYRKGMGTDTTHWRVGTQGRTHSTRWAAVWAMRRAAHDGQNPRRLQLKG